jgi:uncharacterized RDD family membrane protein YckC
VKGIEADDVVGIVGLVLIVTGVAFWSLPVAVILTGLILFVYASGLYMAAHRLLLGFVNRHGATIGKQGDGNISSAS